VRRAPRLLARGLAALTTVGTGLVAVLLTGGPAAAANGDYGDPRPLSRTLVLLVFAGIPLAALLVLAALTLRAGRGVGAVAYRPGRPWGYPRQWFGTAPPAAGAIPRVSVPGLGGASARW